MDDLKLDREILDNMNQMSEEDIFNSIFSPDDLDIRALDLRAVANSRNSAKKDAVADGGTVTDTQNNADRVSRDKHPLREDEIVEVIAEPEVVEVARTPAERIELHVSSDKSEATITLKKPNSAEKPLTAEELLTFLKDSGIKQRIYVNYIERLSNTPVFDTPIRVAAGQRPTEGTDGSLEFYFTEGKGDFKVDEKGNVDFFDYENSSFVKEGEQLARIIPPVPGKDGYNVYGETVRCKAVKPVDNPLGYGVELDETGTYVIAKISGEVSFKNKRISISNVLRLQNVDYSTGNVDFNGSVIVNGNVYSGFKVQCTGDLSIRGFAEEAELRAGGSVEIKSGMNGGTQRKGSITAGSRISCFFLENVIVNADGDLSIDSMINCNATVKGNITALGKYGCIIGGVCTVNGNITAQTIGNDAQVITRIEICGKEKISERRDALTEQIKNDEQTKEKLIGIMDKISIAEQNEEMREAAKRKIFDLMNKIDAEIHTAKETVASLEKKLLTQSNMGFIKAGSTLYPNVVIEISGKRFINRKSRHQCIIRKMDDGVHVISNGKEDEE